MKYQTGDSWSLLLFVCSVQTRQLAHFGIARRPASVAETVVAIDQTQWVSVHEREHGYKYLKDGEQETKKNK